MKTTHSLTITARCPVDNLPDVYELTVETSRVVPVEEILRAVDEVTKQKAYQEDITQKLARRLKATVRTIGVHSGVRTECIAP